MSFILCVLKIPEKVTKLESDEWKKWSFIQKLNLIFTD